MGSKAPLIGFIGSYTRYITPSFGGTGAGLTSVSMDASSGELSVLHNHDAINPSYFTISPDNQFLYAVSELVAGDSPALNSYRIASDYSLKYQMQQPVDGGCPCHISLIQGQLVVACYETGNVVQYPLGDDGAPLASVTNHYHVGASEHPERQTRAHAHQVIKHPTTQDIYVCDLGIDTIKAYTLEQQTLVPKPEHDISLIRGGGVRHMILSQDGQVAYAINELTAQISILLANDGAYEQHSVVSSLPSTYQGEPSGSAIRLHPTQPLLYVANRGLEAITIFKVNAEGVELVDYQFTGGQELREFNISPCGQWLLACHQNSHDIVVYKIQPQGLLSECYRTRQIESPACMSFLHQPQIPNRVASYEQ